MKMFERQQLKVLLACVFVVVATKPASVENREVPLASETSGELRTVYLGIGPRWEINDQCYVVCYTLPIFFWQCSKLQTHAEICQRLNFQHPQRCCDPYVPNTSSTTSTSTTTTTTTTPSTTTSSTTTETPSTSSTTTPPTTPMPSSYCGSMPPEMCAPEPGCASNCPGGNCRFYGATRSSCYAGCSQFCGNPCGCRSHANGACDYNVVTGTCQYRQLECSSTMFTATECGRLNAFYLDGGLSCKNTRERGNCSVSHNVFAVNINGQKFTDSRGIAYLADNSGYYRDPYKIRRVYDIQTELSTVDRNLYGLFIRGHPEGNASEQCITYGIGIRENGRYELALRMVEPSDDKPGTRLFNIMLHDTVVVAELDIFALVSILKPLDLLINFLVWTDVGTGIRFIDMKGHSPKPFPGILRLAVCIEKCQQCPGYPADTGVAVISGFSVLRLEV